MTIFSKIIKGDIPSYQIAQNELFYAFLDIAPLQLGHTLVVPKIEIDKIFDLPNNYLQNYLPFCQTIAKAIEKSFDCNRVSMITVGIDVPHAHIHLIPFKKASDLYFSNTKLQLTSNEFSEIQEKIKSNLIS